MGQIVLYLDFFIRNGNDTKFFINTYIPVVHLLVSLFKKRLHTNKGSQIKLARALYVRVYDLWITTHFLFAIKGPKTCTYRIAMFLIFINYLSVFNLLTITVIYCEQK